MVPPAPHAVRNAFGALLIREILNRSWLDVSRDKQVAMTGSTAGLPLAARAAD